LALISIRGLGGLAELRVGGRARQLLDEQAYHRASSSLLDEGIALVPDGVRGAMTCYTPDYVRQHWSGSLYAVRAVEVCAIDDLEFDKIHDLVVLEKRPP
jgi:hypothetical protein